MCRCLKYWLIIFALFPFCPLYSQQKDEIEKALENIGVINISNFTPRDFQANPHNYDAIQDNRGFMYFGNLWGLLEFNGTEWRKIFLPNGISCTSLAKDQNGTIYIGGRNEIGYLKEDSSGRKNYVSIRKKVPREIVSFNEVWKTYDTPSGILFISYEVLLLKPKGKEDIVVIRENVLNAFFSDNRIIVFDEDGLSEYKNGKFEVIVGSDVLEGKFINSVVSYKNHLLLGTNENGLFLFDGKSLRSWDSQVNNRFKGSGFDKVIKINDHLFITSLLNGILMTDNAGNILMHLNKSNGLLSNSISACYKDYNGNLWITSNSGISYVPLSDNITYLNDFSGVSGTPYSSAIYHGDLYLSTSEGLFKKSLTNDDPLDAQKFERVKGISGLIWNLFVYDNKLFCGQATGTYVIEGNETVKVMDHGTWLFHPLDNPKLILIGTYNGLGILEKKNQKWTFGNFIKGFNESSRFIEEDIYGDFWVSHGNKGVYQIRVNKMLDSVVRIKQYGKANGLSEDYDNTVFTANNEIIITGASGIYKYDHDNEKIIPFFAFSKILGENSHVERIVKISSNKYWVVYNRGTLAKIEVDKENRYKKVWETKKIKDSWIEAFEHLNPLSEKMLLLGTQEGFAVLRLSGHNSEKAKRDFNCYITKIQANSKSEVLFKYFSEEKAKVPEALDYDYRSLKFFFTSTSYEDIDNNQYQYFLEGFEDKWSDWSNIPFKEYTNLKEGDYKFRVRGQNSDGIVTKETILELTIDPPWHRTIFAYIGYVLAVIFITYFVYRQIKKQLAREKKKIELEKQRKIWEKQKKWDEAVLEKEKQLMILQQEKLEAEAYALHQKEMMLFQEQEKERKILEIQKEKFEADLINKNNELSSLTVHITQKNELLTKIKNSIQKSAKESSDAETIKSLSHVQSLIEKGLNSSREWEKFQEHFDNVHEGFLKRLQHDYPDLKPSSLKLCAYLKMRLSSKQISVLMNTAPDSVIKARYRLRLKFNLDKETGLEEFLNSY